MNCAARLISGVGKFDHITPIMESLHWCPMEFSIKFTVLCLAYNALHGLAPAYLTNILAWYEPARNLCSTGQDLLVVPKIRTNKYGAEAFAYAALSLFNDLPTRIHQAPSFGTFKGRHKTHFFSIAYSW